MRTKENSVSTRAVPKIWQTFERPILPRLARVSPRWGGTAFEDGGPTRVQRWFAKGRQVPAQRARRSRGQRGSAGVHVLVGFGARCGGCKMHSRCLPALLLPHHQDAQSSRDHPKSRAAVVIKSYPPKPLGSWSVIRWSYRNGHDAA